ncbi:hypothetical protein SAMN03097699_0427 [Flavobacteriaceae bacterium MAR_2010_188]|nr:hypothetical protein SAMN03097699_0427 [Flavobacteriaceae bacterium MAR_2010_188]
MNWMFEDFKSDLEDLNPMLRKKAIEIANQLMETGEFDQEKALREGIIRAEQWFFNLEG